ncbi:hypothetical protein niasHT_006479 [Heterodera trifolii]|uniref:Uncharacterized protein n=1 Tax=Heterodera trifolii TaxID=157864 RepID=A0ABD2LU87_9BILA
MVNLFAVLLFIIIQFESGDSNDQKTSDKIAFNAEELCRPINGTPFHEQCLLSTVVKQKGFIPRHLRPPWLGLSLFEDNELSEESAKNDGCYGCYKGTKASNVMAPREEYCACTMPTCGNKYFDHLKHCAMVHFYDNDPEKAPKKPPKKERILALLDGCIIGANKNCSTVNVKVEYREWKNFGNLPHNCKGEGRVQEMRGLQLDLQTGGAVQWRDPAGGYEYAKQTTLNWQPTDLNKIKRNGMPDGALMYPDFVIRPVGQSEFLLDLFKYIYLQWSKEEDTVVAPQLAAVGLAIAYIGARRNTKVQIGKVLLDEEGNDSDVIKSEDIEPRRTKIVIVNVAHFHAKWGPLIGQFIYKNEENFQFICVPIGSDNDKLDLAIVAPKDFLNLPLVLKELKGAKLLDLVTNSPTTEAKVS